MNQSAWAQLCADVTQRMSKHVANFVTPLTMSEEHGSGVAWGSGTYIQGAQHVWVLTAGHVLMDVPEGGRLAHLPVPDGEYNAAFGTPEVKGGLEDVAALPVHPDPKVLPATGRILPPSAIAQRFEADEEELLFWMGFPGYAVNRDELPTPASRRVSMYEQLSTPWKPMLMQAIKDIASVTHSAFDSTKHIAVHYPERGTRASDGQEVPLPHPKGMSGSALWDTKAVGSMKNGIQWRPEMAKVCGVVWGAPPEKPLAIFATKIEHVRRGLPNVF
jgi:hypothetical protein